MSSVFEFSFRGDALTGFFMITISLVTFAVSVYSIGFTRDLPHAGFMGFFYNLLILSLYAVVLSANIFTFLISWETMAIASYFLVVFERNEKAARAGLFYAVMTHIGTAFLIALFFILYRYTNRMDFEGMKAGLSGMPQGVKSIIFIFSVIGFGAKVGHHPTPYLDPPGIRGGAVEYRRPHVRPHGKDGHLRIDQDLHGCDGAGA